MPAPPSLVQRLPPHVAERLWAGRRALRRHRRLVSAALAAVCLAAALRSMAPPARATVAVWVAARDLPGGARLSSTDLTRARWPPGTVPAGTLGAAALGRTLAGALRRGEPVTDVRLVGPGVLAVTGPGLVATPVRLADAAVAGLLRPGDLVTVLAAPADPAARQATTTAASAVRVLAVPTTSSDGVAASDGALVLLATTPREAVALAAAATADRLSVVLLPGPSLPLEH